MSDTRSLFPGAMGPDGFVSCFDHLIHPQQLRRKLILKGGPGVGKSTFMRRIHAELCKNGEPSTLYFCSGDPDSLDAIAIAHKGLLILDGTAPHIIDPEIPGARDSLINLGEFLDEPAMRPRLAHIRSIMADHKASMRRAGACLRAAKPLLRDSAAIITDALDPLRLSRITRALIQSVLDGPSDLKESMPNVRTVIADAVTCKGELSLIAENPLPRIIRLTGHGLMDFTPALRAVSQAAKSKDLGVEEYLNPQMPGSLLHVAIPALGTLVTTSSVLPSEQIFDFSSCIPQGMLLRRECVLEQAKAGAALHIRRAVDALKAAKQLHDELEAFYVPNMDFSRWQKKLDETLDSLA